MLPEEEKRTLAVVDADATARALVARTFESLGHRVVEAASSKGLVENLGGIDGVLIDPIVAANGTPSRFDLGLDLLLRLRRQSPSLPIAIISADARVEVVIRTMRLGACDYVTKPAERARIVVAASRLVEASDRTNATRGPDVLPSYTELEQRLIEVALRWNRGQVARTARMLGIGRATLYRKLGEMGHPLPRGGKRRPS